MKREFDPEKKLYTLAILVQDIPGVLSQVARLFARKGYNIESIVTGGTDRPNTARLAISILADEATSIQREFSLIKVRATDRNSRDEVIQMANIFRANIIDVGRDTLTVAIFGDRSKTRALTDLLADFGILEIAKTGTLAIERGRSTIYDDNKLKEEYNYGKNVL